MSEHTYTMIEFVGPQKQGDSRQTWVNLIANDAWPSDKATPGAEDPVTGRM